MYSPACWSVVINTTFLRLSGIEGSVIVSMVTQPKPEKELAGLVWGTTRDEEPEAAMHGDDAWYRSPKLLGYGALALCVVLNIIFL